MTADEHPSRMHRRGFLLAGGTALLGAACGSTKTASTNTTGATVTSTTAAATSTTVAGAASSTTTAGAATTTAFTAADFAGLGACAVLPEKTAGPFPLDRQLMRRDITEGYPGHPLRLGLRVLDETCQPLPGATVEIWHCDATGDYSAFTDGGGGKDEAGTTTFLRGSQTAGDDGIVEFTTIVPGWYRGRAVHIHLRVHHDDRVVLTSQLFFDLDDLRRVYADAAYADNGLPDTTNENDGIAGDPATEHTLLALRATGSGSTALLNLGVG